MALRSRGLLFCGRRLLTLSPVVVAGSRASQLGSQRDCSHRSWEDIADGEIDPSLGIVSEQAIREIRIRKAAPDWLPFFPGGSFWIHPDQIATKPRERSGPLAPLLEPTCEDEVMAMVAPMGWPTASASDAALIRLRRRSEVEFEDIRASWEKPTFEEELEDPPEVELEELMETLEEPASEEELLAKLLI